MGGASAATGSEWDVDELGEAPSVGEIETALAALRRRIEVVRVHVQQLALVGSPAAEAAGGGESADDEAHATDPEDDDGYVPFLG